VCVLETAKLLLMGCSCCAYGVFGMSVHLYLHGEREREREGEREIITNCRQGVIAGKLTTGALSRRIGGRWMFLASLSLLAGIPLCSLSLSLSLALPIA